MLHNIQKRKKDFFEICVLLSLFLFLVTISYYHVEQSISVMKYLFVYGIRFLSENYSLYHQSFQEFLFKTSAYHTADSESGWRTVFYLWPLFIFCDFLGGLSLKSMHLFTITSLLILVGLFYWWIRGIWGKQVALYAAFFLGFSSVFQEIARSGSYDAYSLLIGMIWIAFFFYCGKSDKVRNYFLLGLFTGLTWYGYGILRYLTIVVIAYVIFLKCSRKFLVLGVLLAGMMIVLIPGFLINIEVRHINMATYHKPLYQLFFDENASFRGGNTADVIRTNLAIFGQRIFGEPELMDRPMKVFHASLWNFFLAMPLLIGMWTALRSRRQLPDRLLLLLAFIIYLAPCFLCNHGIKSRRVLFYIIPSYCFIGLGMKEIVGWISNIRSVFLKYMMVILAVSILFVVLGQEMAFFQTEILSSKRDFGFLAFADKVKKSGVSGDMYYLDKKSTLHWTQESIMMRVALMEKGRSSFNVISGNIRSSLPAMPPSFYLSVNPGILRQEFDDWCVRNRVQASLVFESPVMNSRRFRKEQSFKFYSGQRVE